MNEKFLTTNYKSPVLFRLAVALGLAAVSVCSHAQAPQFHIEEASITDIQNGIKSGQTSCKKVVEAYLARAKAYNGVCTELLTKDGAPISPTTGMVRAGAPIQYPTSTVAVSKVFPDYDQLAT
jgi:amidase